MKIKNETHWRTKDLRAFATRVARLELKPDHAKRYTVHVNYGGRGESCSGHAYCNSNACYVHVSSVSIDRIDFAYVLAHEMAHSRGLRHKDINGLSRYDRVGKYRERYAWADNLPLEKKIAKPKKTTAEKADLKIVNCFEKINTWGTKAKRANNAIRKWKRKLKYYEKRKAAILPETTKK